MSNEKRSLPGGVGFAATEPADTLVYIVDDEKDVGRSISKLLMRAGYQVMTFDDPIRAITAIETVSPRLLITDERMPGLSGLELTRRAQEIDPDLAVVVLTGGGSEETAAAFLRLGVSNYLVKPMEAEALEAATRSALLQRDQAEYRWKMRAWLSAEISRQTRTIEDLSIGALGSLVNALEARNKYFRGHSSSVALCSAGIARALGLDDDDIAAIRSGGLLHDVGMIAVPDRIVEKPQDLTGEEYEQLQRHCIEGAKILEPLPHLRATIRYVLEHHERVDGSGYPQGLVAGEVSLGGQIVGLAEAWTATLEQRPYRAGFPKTEAIALFEDHAGRWFDAEVVHALRRAEGLE